MSMHKKPLTKLEEEGLRLHGLDIGTPSQLSDVFRHGVAWAQSQEARAQLPSQGGEPVGVVLTEEQMGIGYDRRIGPVLWFGTPPPGAKLYTHPADQVPEGGQHARDSAELRRLCAARDQYRDLSIKYGDKLSEVFKLLARCQEKLDPHRDAVLWGDVCVALGITAKEKP